MSLSLTRESHGGGDNSWLGSRRGVATARTVTLDASAFTGPVVKSGTPVSVTDGLAVPYTEAAGLEGFIVGDQSVAGGDSTAPLLDHGRVVVAKLPVAFTAPATAGQFVFV